MCKVSSKNKGYKQEWRRFHVAEFAQNRDRASVSYLARELPVAFVPYDCATKLCDAFVAIKRAELCLLSLKYIMKASPTGSLLAITIPQQRKLPLLGIKYNTSRP